ncbi:hypothetical protein FEM48_Zijuj10G0022800 [Ziziphus jujuba var. spinosa]|uniref:Disease resistance protein At3g14460 n=1 Tax=Ziziphus jujuba var. spinosa TaxID=714518 RepID=A0A978UKQ1_ZIZJJ|nr:hypothetical protein FEM48_Zijuj10G0022800 [Ziziphus jujuba var. spinosa]
MMKVRHLVVALDVSLQRFGAISKAIHLRTLLTLYGYSFLSLSNEVLNNVILKLRCLRILSSSGCVFLKQLSDSIAELKHLRFLDLSCTSIKRLPNSNSHCNAHSKAHPRVVTIKDCCNSLGYFPLDFFPKLISLSISFCENLESLGVSLDGDGMLTSLSYISIYGCPKFVSFPKGRLHASNLTRLRVEGSKKLKKLPEQMRNLLPFLNTLQISNCPKLESFPEGGLPSNLNRLWVMNCPKLIAQRMKWNLHACQALKNFSIGDECGEEGVELFPEEGLVPSTLSSIRAKGRKGKTGTPFLTSPTFRWTTAPFDGVMTPTLRELKLGVCEKLRLDELPHKAESIHIGGNNGVESLIEAINKGQTSFLKKVHIQNCCSAITLLPKCLPITLTELEIKYCKKLEFPLQRSLKSSSICIVTIRDCCDSLRYFPLDFFPKLISLSISFCENLESLGVSLDGDGMLTSLSYISVYGCPNFVSFPKGGLHAPNLTRLRVEGSKKLKKLPEQMRNLLPFLNTLQISNCPKLEPFLECGLPFNLNRLWIMNCPKLIAQQMKWNLHAFQVLKNFSIGDEFGGGGVELFPEEGLVPSTLSSICIHKFPHLKMLDRKGLQQFTSLECLCISKCPQLEKLSQQRLPIFLKHFQIDDVHSSKKGAEGRNGKTGTSFLTSPEFGSTTAPFDGVICITLYACLIGTIGAIVPCFLNQW